ncbi:hypothetical protein L596_007888 [Steinernema carpocapsae]|uniref:Phosphatidylinositol-3,4,5-trisphosphate 3-phosphatase n=1 Tax=Steinernema carpocapsae TaxID=34508 RepID=A0A4U5PB32_STECR|nr:hypothetical protein L596_007888 [Steinernema carpocapsae]
MLCFRSPGGEHDEITCYGTPRSDRRRKHSERSKSNGDVVHASARMDPCCPPSSLGVGAAERVEFSQITSRLAALTFPSNGSDFAYRSCIKEISEKLKSLYHDNYKVFNVSQKRSDLGRSNPVVELGWPDQLAPPLDRLCSICKHIETFLQANPEHVLVLHCKGGRSRAAIVVAAYMHYTSICSSEDSVADRFSMQMFSEKFLGSDGQPSHKRYVTYFSNLLSGQTRVNQSPIFLSQCSLARLTGRTVTIKIYERMKPVYTSAPIFLRDSSTQFELEAPLSLRGDVLVKCFQKTSAGDRDRAPLFQCQFNTCALEVTNNNALTLSFYKDELDLIFDDPSIDNHATVEFLFLLEPPKDYLKKQRKSLSEFSRADSYENFDKPEDDRSASEAASSALIYSEISRSSNASTTISSSTPATAVADGTDSGIGSDSPKFNKEGAMPPVPPPKPRRASVDDALLPTQDENTGAVTRQHSVLPAGLRPVKERPPTPTEGGRVTPRIEPDLVAKDRYDPNSKCFSYVPAKSLNEHFTSPKKPPIRRPSEERSVIEPLPDAVKSSLKNLTFSASDLTRRPETPKWEEQIDKVVDKMSLRSEMPAQRSASIDPEYRSLRSLPVYGDDDISLSSSIRPNGFVHEDFEEKPVIVNQAKKATKTKRKTKYGSYRTLNDDAYNSDMDELCDPDFYLTYTPVPSTAPTTAPNSSISQNGSKSVELPRKTFKPVSPRDIDEFSDIMDSPPQRPLRSCITPKPFSTPYDDDHQNSEAFRYRNCRSVTSTPLMHGRKLFAHDRYDSLTDAENADDWLTSQLRKVRQKRDNDPDVLKRKKQEKILLEELKNAHSDKELARNRHESDYTVEGVGQRMVDPLLDYQNEEERLKNTRSPFPDRDFGRRGSDYDSSRRVMPPLANRPIVRSKPPTPPPRERSRSPPRSPFNGRRAQTPNQATQQQSQAESAYRQERSHILSRTEDALTDDEDEGAFSHLKSLVQRFLRQSLPPREPLRHNELHDKHRNQVDSEAPRDGLFSGHPSNAGDIYASPTTFRRAQTPGEESTTPRQQRSETPAFPVAKRGETPLPYHPLLYNGAASQANGAPHHGHSLTYRSASPRSFYYGGAQSRRSSMTSIVWILWLFTHIRILCHAINFIHWRHNNETDAETDAVLCSFKFQTTVALISVAQLTRNALITLEAQTQLR